MSKQTVAVIFGGMSSEHEVSCISVQTIVEYIDKNKYDIILIGITKEGRWIAVDNVESIADGSFRKNKRYAYLLPDAGEKSIIYEENGVYSKVDIDAVFPVLHGLYGEDGSIQGLCELAGIPYVGCGILASAVGMDKVYTKLIADQLGVKQANYEIVLPEDMLSDSEYIIKKIEGSLSYPVFVKPSNAGSSKGINKAHNRDELRNAIIEAHKHDRKAIVEEMIVGREIECAVLGTVKSVESSGVGEICSAGEFYDFDSKYNNADSKTVVNPDISEKSLSYIREMAKKIFIAIDGHGLARVDFFVKSDGEVVFNEINTMPGFTAISMYPMLWEAAGITKFQLVNRLIELAYERG